MPVFGILLLLTGLVLFAFTAMHAPDTALFRVPWSYKPQFYYLFLATSVCFASYGIYEIVTELLGRGRPGKNAEGLPETAVKKCPRCAEYVRSEAKICRYCHYEFSEAEPIQTGEGHLCETCGQPVIIPASVAAGESGFAPMADRPSPKDRLADLPAAIAALLAGSVVLGLGIYGWLTLSNGASQTTGPGKPLAGQKSADIQAGPAPAPQTAPQPPAPSVRESPGPFRVGSRWAIDWRSKHRYRGVMELQKQLAPDKYLATLAVTYRTGKKSRKTVWMDGLVTVTGREVVINCRNPSVSWWDTDDFYLKWQPATLTGYNVDKKGRRGKAVFTLMEG